MKAAASSNSLSDSQLLRVESACGAFAGLLLEGIPCLGLLGSESLVAGGWLQNGCQALQHRNQPWQAIRQLFVDNPRARGIIMLNLLVLLYATNWCDNFCCFCSLLSFEAAPISSDSHGIGHNPSFQDHCEDD